MLLLQSLNVGFFVFHTGLIFFNVFGWAWKRLRPWNLATLCATAFSWGVMGAWKGVGYCICTDWHWQVREALGIHETSSSYISLLVRSISGWDPPDELTKVVALVVFLGSLVLSVLLNGRDLRERRKTFKSLGA